MLLEFSYFSANISSNIYFCYFVLCLLLSIIVIMSSTSEILAKYDELSSKLDKLSSLEESMALLSNKYDDLLKTCDCLTKEVKELKLENRSLKAQVFSSQSQIEKNTNDIDDLEQYSRRDCLEIRGVPQLHNEDTDDLVKKVGELIDVDINYVDISTSHRLSDGIQRRSDGVQIKRDPAIIVKFTKRSDRDDFYRSRKLLKGKTTEDLGFSRSPPQPIFIAESLTKKKKDLFNLCLKVKKQFGYKFIWSFYGKICLRKDVNSPVLNIKTIDDLRKFNMDIS